MRRCALGLLGRRLLGGTAHDLRLNLNEHGLFKVELRSRNLHVHLHPEHEFVMEGVRMTAASSARIPSYSSSVRASTPSFNYHADSHRAFLVRFEYDGNSTSQQRSENQKMISTISPQQSQTAQIKPLLSHGAIERTGNAVLPGNYCEQRHVWLIDGVPAVQALTGLAELVTKTEAQLERDDNSDSTLLELQTKTKAEVEQDDQEFSVHLLGLATKTRADTHERDD